MHVFDYETLIVGEDTFDEKTAISIRKLAQAEKDIIIVTGGVKVGKSVYDSLADMQISIWKNPEEKNKPYYLQFTKPRKKK